MQQTNTRLWWMEVLRGIVAISFGLMFIFIDVRLFIYAVGAYLIIDGSLDAYKIAKGKRATKRRVLSYLGSALSILLGLICFVFHLLALFFILFIIVIRIIIRVFRVLFDARGSGSRYAGLIWLYGALLGLYILALIIFPSETLNFKLHLLFIFISAYALCDGLYLIGRGLLLRFAPGVFTRSTSQILENQPEFLDNIPLTTRRAVVFVRRLGANGLGHIGWAFEWNNGWFNTGSVENKKTNRMPNRKRWDSGRRIRSIQLRLCAGKTVHMTSINFSILRNLTLKKPGKPQSGKVGNHIMPYVITAMMLLMTSCGRLTLMS
ncbi:MAG: hypothetical protein ACXVCM_05855 [Ktedonobacteraceae bacterium]